jgi:hypothetical protein
MAKLTETDSWLFKNSFEHKKNCLPSKKHAKLLLFLHLCKYFRTFAAKLILYAGNHTALYLGTLPLGGF